MAHYLDIDMDYKQMTHKIIILGHFLLIFEVHRLDFLLLHCV